MSTQGGVGLFTKRLPPRDTRRAMLRPSFAIAVLVALLPQPLSLFGVAPLGEARAAVMCIGDCDGSHDVSSQELSMGVEVALLRADRGGCLYLDPDGDGVTVEELVFAVRAHLESCEAPPTPTPAMPLRVAGRCRRPGPSGLVACDAGFHVEVFRCDDRPACLESAAPKTELGNGEIGDEGRFAVVIDLELLGSNTMLVQAEAALQPATIFRILNVGALGAGGGGRVAGVPELELEIDPSSEGAMRALDADPNPLGLDAFANADIQSLVSATRSVESDYAGLTAEEAAQAAQSIATSLSAPRLMSFLASSGFFAYHAISSGAFAYKFTTLALTGAPTASDGVCAVTSEFLDAGAVAFAPPETNVVKKSAFLEGERVIFNPNGGQDIGRICVGNSCLSDASCPPGANDCQFFAYNENATPLSQGMVGIPDGVRVQLTSTGQCVLAGNTYAFGTPAPTIHAAAESQPPMDGFVLLPNTTIVFAQPVQSGGSFFAGVGGFRLRRGLGATTLSAAVAEVDQGQIP